MPAQQFRTILIFGAPGVGKGTQGKILGTIPGFFHHSSGEVFRALDKQSPEGQQVAQYSSRGELVHDDLTIRIWKNGLDQEVAARRYDPARDLIILDGIPRNVPQAEILADHINVLCVIHLVCSDEDEMVRRMMNRALKENRADDANERVVRHRFEVYHRETAPLLSYYSADLIRDVEAIATPAEVLRSVLDCVIPVQQAAFSGD